MNPRRAPAPRPGVRARAIAWGLAVTFGCAPIDVNSEVSLHPRQDQPPAIGLQQLSGRDFVVAYVQAGPRLLVEVREHRTCVGVRHVPVMRVEEITRTSRGFVAWDFALGVAAGGFAAVAFARPELFSSRLVDDQGRVVYDTTSGYVIGGLFATISAGLFAAGIVNALRARDETRYAAAFELELGAETACADSAAAGQALADRALRLRVAALKLELDATTDGEGRARFELPTWTAPIPRNGLTPVVLEVTQRASEAPEPKQIGFGLRVPYDGMIDAHTGVADTRASATEAPAIEGPALDEGSP